MDSHAALRYAFATVRRQPTQRVELNILSAGQSDIDLESKMGFFLLNSLSLENNVLLSVAT